MSHMLGAMDTTGADHALHPSVPPRLFRMLLIGPHNEETSTGLLEAADIARKALFDRGYTVTLDHTSWDYEEPGGVVVLPWYRRLSNWLRFWR